MTIYRIPETKKYLLKYFTSDIEKKVLKITNLPTSTIKKYIIEVGPTGNFHIIEVEPSFDVAILELKKIAFEKKDKQLLDEISELENCKVG